MAEPEERAVLRQNIEVHKRELRLAVDDLREAALSWTDPRDLIRERPATWLLVGLAAGLWLGMRR
ncbi:MAG TPA: hypothetical protein VGR62_11360 [Candidatus Binatia bacterium]|jgi:hypothetical protein|nr:hypothetical protein [Candidatus Binatia bacterium]